MGFKTTWNSGGGIGFLSSRESLPELALGHSDDEEKVDLG